MECWYQKKLPMKNPSPQNTHFFSDFKNDFIFMNLRIVQSAKMGIFFSYQLNDLALCILNHLLFFLLSACFESIYY